jgi:hypothetical protein
MEAKEKELYDKLAAILQEYSGADKNRRAELILQIEALEDEAGQYFGAERSRLRQVWTDKQHNFIAATFDVIKKIRLNG